MDRLLGAGRTVMVETGGHISIEQVPAAGHQDRGREVPGQRRVAPQRLGRISIGWRGTTKSSSSSRTAPTTSTRATSSGGTASSGRVAAVLFSPVHGMLDPKQLAGLDPRGPARRPPAAAGPQVHLGRPMSAESSAVKAVVLLSGGLDSYTAARTGSAGRLRALRADDSLRPGPRARGRGRADRSPRARRRRARRARRSISQRSADRRWSATATFPRTATSASTRHSVDLRAGAEHGVPLAGAGLGRSRRRRRDRHRRERARLLRLSGLPARVSRGVRAAGVARDPGRCRGHAATRASLRSSTCRRRRSSAPARRSASTTA